MIRKRSLKKAGICLAIIAVAPAVLLFFAPYLLWRSSLNVPVTLTPGVFNSPEVRTDVSSQYDLILVADRQQTGPSFDRELCLMGFAPGVDCRDIKQTVTFDWRVVSENGEVIKAGTYIPEGMSGSQIIFGEFQGRLFGRQSLVLNIRQDAGELNRLHPRLRVDAVSDYQLALPDWLIYSLVWAVIVGVAAIVAFVVGSRRDRKIGE